jgi:hypothetical protein
MIPTVGAGSHKDLYSFHALSILSFYVCKYMHPIPPFWWQFQSLIFQHFNNSKGWFVNSKTQGKSYFSERRLVQILLFKKKAKKFTVW